MGELEATIKHFESVIMFLHHGGLLFHAAFVPKDWATSA
jgi:hypothetical protein